jgi:hypothetical protein
MARTLHSTLGRLTRLLVVVLITDMQPLFWMFLAQCILHHRHLFALHKRTKTHFGEAKRSFTRRSNLPAFAPNPSQRALEPSDYGPCLPAGLTVP